MAASVTDLNIAEVEKSKFASNLGTAHEFLVTGILMRLGLDVSICSVKGGPYDLLITVFEDGPHSAQRLLRAAVRTASPQGQIKLGAGGRGGVNREYKSGVKVYKYTEEHNDLIIGVDTDSMDLYLIPTRLAQRFGMSKSKRLLQVLRNNWDVLLRWNDKFLGGLEQQF